MNLLINQFCPHVLCDMQRMKRKDSTPHGVKGHQYGSHSASKQRRLASQSKDIPLTSVFAKLLKDVSKKSIAPMTQEYLNARNKQGDLIYKLCTFATRSFIYYTPSRRVFFWLNSHHSFGYLEQMLITEITMSSLITGKEIKCMKVYVVYCLKF